jgi:formylglycine-generating enzyme required for sulfatase activity
MRIVSILVLAAYASACGSDGDERAATCERLDYADQPSYVDLGPATFPVGVAVRVEPGEPVNDSWFMAELTYRFRMDTHEFTKGEFIELAGRLVGTQECDSLDCPMESMTIEKAMWVANARSRRDGFEECYDFSGCTGSPLEPESFACERVITSSSIRCTGYRVPTLAEYSYAIRGGTTTWTVCGRERGERYAPQYGCPVQHAWFQVYPDIYPHLDNDAPRPVGLYCPNDFGIYDGHGNVAELVGDSSLTIFPWDHEGTIDGCCEAPPVVNPQGVAWGPAIFATSSYQTLLDDSGSWSFMPHVPPLAPDFINTAMGVRFVRTLEIPDVVTQLEGRDTLPD